jgi:hypothetical protein
MRRVALSVLFVTCALALAMQPGCSRWSSSRVRERLSELYRARPSFPAVATLPPAEMNRRLEEHRLEMNMFNDRMLAEVMKDPELRAFFEDLVKRALAEGEDARLTIKTLNFGGDRTRLNILRMLGGPLD